MSLEGKTLCFTGTLKTQTRASATKLAKSHGAKVTSTVSKNTSLLVCGPGAGDKLKVAKEKGVEIWTEDEFNACVGLSGDDEATKKPPASAKKKAAPKDPPKTPPKKKAKIDPKTPTPKKAAAVKKPAPATPASPGSSTRKVMSAVSNKSDYSVYEEYDVRLMLSDSLNANSNKFYKLQLLEHVDTGNYYVATNWGRLGEPGQSQLKGPHADVDDAIKAFGKVFKSKTKNTWGKPFERFEGKYQLVETTTDCDEDATADAALGRLTEAQVHKGQEVLKELRDVLESKPATTKEGSKTQKVNKVLLGELSNKFYSLIPTTSGRQRPPPLDNLDIVTEKEGLLEFWLRMGFEEMTPMGLEGSPIGGVPDLLTPPNLSVAANKISDSYSIEQSRNRGMSLSQKKAGSPSKPMGPELYAAILLYTGNSIYRELNRCLRTEWSSVPKYWNYLKLYLDATDCMPKRAVTLWRGIAVDLYDEYEVGKVITWWTISSCTADKSVAENFMNQLGGAAATLLTLHTKMACDISALSFYPHEKESLLRPGTKLKVLNRKKNGKVTEIEVEEVVGEEE